MPFNRTRKSAPVPAAAARKLLESKPRSSNTIICACGLRISRIAWGGLARPGLSRRIDGRQDGSRSITRRAAARASPAR